MSPELAPSSQEPQQRKPIVHLAVSPDAVVNVMMRPGRTFGEHPSAEKPAEKRVDLMPLPDIEGIVAFVAGAARKIAQATVATATAAASAAAFLPK